MKTLIAITILLLSSQNQAKDTNKLIALNADYANCLVSIHGGFEDEKEADRGANILMHAMVVNLRKALKFEQIDQSADTVFISDDIRIGYRLRAQQMAAEKTRSFDRDFTYKAFNYEWRELDTRRWRDKGCNAIYNSLDN